MGCGCSNNASTQQQKISAKVYPVVTDKPEYLTSFEQLLICIKNNKSYNFITTEKEVNYLLGMIGTMNIQNNYGLKDLTSQYNRIKEIECQ